MRAAGGNAHAVLGPEERASLGAPRPEPQFPRGLPWFSQDELFSLRNSFQVPLHLRSVQNGDKDAPAPSESLTDAVSACNVGASTRHARGSPLLLMTVVLGVRLRARARPGSRRLGLAMGQ